MTRQDKQLIRQALAIHKQIETEPATAPHIELPAATWQQCELLLRRINKAQRRGWQLAARRLQRDFQATLQRLHGELISLDRLLAPPQTPSRRPSVRDLHADLVALSKEFDTVTFGRRARTIAVTTEPIELEGIYLGPFEIRLDWSDLTDGHPNNYRVIALDSHPAASTDSVTHPHVQDEAVCEGEGRQPIRQALQQGRLLDFFLIVANLLRTYNAESPYVSLADWNGVECTDCGMSTCDDERYTCEKCETTVCSECYFNCPGCDGIYCNECVIRCEGCDENHCGSCLKSCSQCSTLR